MDVRRGFNRLFIVAWVLWVLFGVWWAMDVVAKDRASLNELIYEGEHGRSWDPHYRATESDLTRWRTQRDEETFWRFAGYFVTTKDPLFLVLPATIYVVLFAAGWAARWVYLGFRGDARTRPPTDVE